jgi:hypothetical protein
MTQPLVAVGSFLNIGRLARAPLRDIALLAAGLTVTFSAYCIGYALIVGGDVDPLLSVAWAAAAVLPWAATWPLARHLAGRTGCVGLRRPLAVLLPLCLAALAAAALERFGALAFGVEHGAAFAELLFRKLPLVVVLAAVAVAAARSWKASAPPTESAIDVSTRSGAIQVALGAVEWVKAAGNYLELHTGDGSCHLVRSTLKSFAAERGADRFVQIHRSLLVHRDRGVRVERLAGGRLALRVRDGQALPVGRQFRGGVLRHFGGRPTTG